LNWIIGFISGVAICVLTLRKDDQIPKVNWISIPMAFLCSVTIADVMAGQMGYVNSHSSNPYDDTSDTVMVRFVPDDIRWRAMHAWEHALLIGALMGIAVTWAYISFRCKDKESVEFDYNAFRLKAGFGLFLVYTWAVGAHSG